MRMDRSTLTKIIPKCSHLDSPLIDLQYLLGLMDTVRIACYIATIVYFNLISKLFRSIKRVQMFHNFLKSKSLL